MKETPHISIVEHIGRLLGHVWRAGGRQEARAILWLSTKGLTAGAGRLLLWIVKLSILVFLFYVAFWLALLAGFIVVAAWLARNADLKSDLPEPEWRNGPAGYGLYTYDGHRIDPHVHDEDN